MVVLAACASAVLEPAASAPGPRALDGDTVVLADGTRVRIAGVDCPERGRRLARAATELAASFVGDPRAEVVPAEVRLDVYGRRLADLELDGRRLSEALVAAGLAWIYRTDEPGLRAAQREAVLARRGVWADVDACAELPLRATAGTVHRADCPAARAGAVPSWEPERPFLEGRAPCRSCLPWPPARVSLVTFERRIQ